MDFFKMICLYLVTLLFSLSLIGELLLDYERIKSLKRKE